MPAPQGTEPQPIDELAQDELLGLISDGFSTAVGDIWDFSTDLPGFVAREGPESPPAAAIKPVLRLACRRYARGGGPQNLPGFDAAWGSICEPYLESIGENPLPGGLGLPFVGGQCEINYFVQYSYNTVNTDGSPGGTFTPEVGPILGPIRGIERRGAPGSYAAVITSGNGVESVVNSSSAPQGGLENLKITQIFAAGGGTGPDCGNPPPVYDPPKVRPGLPTLPPSTPIEFPGIGPIGVDVTFDPDGTVNISLPDIGVEVGIEDPFGLGGDGDGGEGGGPPPGDVGAPGPPVAVGPGDAEEGIAPEGSVLVGLRVQVVTVPNRRNRYTDEVLRGAYYVYMGVPGLLDHDPAGAMVRADQFIFAEQPNLTAWRIRANTGYELVTTPYYRQIEA